MITWYRLCPYLLDEPRGGPADAFFVRFGANVSEAGGAIPVRGCGTEEARRPRRCAMLASLLVQSATRLWFYPLPLISWFFLSLSFRAAGRSVSCGRLAVRVPSAHEVLLVVEARDEVADARRARVLCTVPGFSDAVGHVGVEEDEVALRQAHVGAGVAFAAARKVESVPL